MAFENIIGNSNVKSFLETSINNNNILHSYMFIGTSGIGKKLFAKDFSKTILCNSSNDLPNIPCNNCDSCLKFETDNHPDFTIITPLDGKSIKIDQIRFLTEKIAEKPILSSKKIYIIDDSDSMTIEAQNCLLKTLEAPPEYAIIILIVSNENKMLNTIKSRCTKVSFKSLSNDEIKKYFINNKMSLDDNIIKVCGGSIGKAILLQNESISFESIDNLINNLFAKSDIIDIFNNSSFLYDSKDNIFDLLEYMNIVFMDKLKSSNDLRYTNCIKIVEQTKKRLIQNSNFDMSIDALLLNIWEELIFERNDFYEKHCRN